MKAVLSTSPGDPDSLQLEDISISEPKDGEVRIRVKACGVNYPDALIIEDKYQFRPERPTARRRGSWKDRCSGRLCVRFQSR